MSISNLPGRIAALMVGTVAVLVLTVAVSVAWMTRAMDDQSRRHSAERVRTALAGVLEETRRITLDYAKWEDAAERVAAGDLAWLDENFGTTATIGEAAQLVAVWGGPMGEGLGWTDAAASSTPGLLPPRLVAIAEAGLAGVPVGTYRGLTFFAWLDGEVYALAAARIESPNVMDGAAASDENLARVAIGHRLDADLVLGIGRGVLLNGLEIVRARPADRPSLPLMGGDARPVGHLAWDPRLAGTRLLHRMLLPLGLVTTLAALLVLAGTWLARRSAGQLVEAEQRWSHAARTDGLTGLPNRLAFNEALAAPALAGERAILFLDLNGFKRINDSLGHHGGDLVIARIAGRLDALRGTGCLLARIGGDEFVFVLSGPRAGLRAEWLAQSVARTMQMPLEVQGREVQLGAAMGYAVQEADDAAGADLVRQADIAMYQAKRRRRCGAVAFGAMIEEADGDARAIEAALRGALAQGIVAPEREFAIAYQPIVDLATGRMVRAEALARWTAPTLGPVSPDRFIAVAEEAGLIVELGRQLLALICEDLRAHPDLHVSLNVSPLQLTAPTFVPDLVNELARCGVAPARVEVELTERVLVDDPVLAARRIDELHAAGFRTALDDFGQGHSSIGTLQQMAFDTLKIDRAFVSGLGASGERLALCNAMILLGRGLGLAIVCEGVETAAELELLRELGCGLAQGYHFDRPQPIGALVARWLGPTAAEAAVA